LKQTNPTPANNPRRAAWATVFLSYGFRPFFLLGPTFASLAMINWLLLRGGGGLQPVSISARDWHIHEMLFGYPFAMIAGFLLTSVPNWTKRPPVAGPWLLILVVTWLAGRVSMLLPISVSYVWVVLIDGLFLPLFATGIGFEIGAARKWRNIKVVIPIALLAGVNIWFQLALLWGGDTAAAIRFEFAALLVLIMLIGGRIIPAFTRNWLKSTGAKATPAMFNKFDALTVVSTGLALFWWGLFSQGVMLGGVFVSVAILQAVRLGRWAGLRSIYNILLFVLHIFYCFIPLGFLCLGFGLMLDEPGLVTAALHLFGIGAIGGMTLAVGTRVALGHTGRSLVADRKMTLIFSLVVFAAFTRALAAIVGEPAWLLTLAGVLWIIGFGLFSLRVGPWLWTVRQSDTW